MTTEIGQLTLRLPPGFERRAARIGRLVGEALAAADLPAGRIPQLGVGPLQVDARRSDRAIAASIAGAIRQGVQGAAK